MAGNPPIELNDIDLTPYRGRWVALIRGRVAGVGLTPEQAFLIARRNRPKEEPGAIIFVDESVLEGADARNNLNLGGSNNDPAKHRAEHNPS